MIKFFFFLFLCNSVQTFGQVPVNIMTFNLRFNTPKDSLNSWPYRKDMVASQILFHAADIIGTQESQYGMVLDLQARLKDYKWKGIDGTEKKDSLNAEWNAVFYNYHRFEVLSSGSFWLSENPEQFNVKGWDAQQGRVALWIEFRDKRNRNRFYYFNTHFDHKGKRARKESATLLMRKIEEVTKGAPVVVTGDFNARPTDDPIKMLMDTADPLHLINSKFASETPHYGSVLTFNDFGKGNHPGTIDYIFVRNNIRVLRHATLSETWDGKFSSDHFPVFVSLIIKGK